MRLIPHTRPSLAIVLLAIISASSTRLAAQTHPSPILGKPEPVPPFLQANRPAPEPTTPPARPFHDARYGVSFTIPPPGTSPAETATSAPSASTPAPPPTPPRCAPSPPSAFNPYPYSTFSGAFFYFSVTPDVTAEPVPPPRPSARAPHTVGTIQGRRRPLHPRLRRARQHLHRIPRRDLHHPPQRSLLPLRPRHQQLLRRRRQRRPGHHRRELDDVRKRLESILNTIHFDSN